MNKEAFLVAVMITFTASVAGGFGSLRLNLSPTWAVVITALLFLAGVLVIAFTGSKQNKDGD